MEIWKIIKNFLWNEFKNALKLIVLKLILLMFIIVFVSAMMYCTYKETTKRLIPILENINKPQINKNQQVKEIPAKQDSVKLKKECEGKDYPIYEAEGVTIFKSK